MAERVGDYELLKRLGAGGMAETFVAVRRRSGGFKQLVCLKRVLPSQSEDEEFTELFLDEAKLIARMRNSRIVQVLDFGEHSGTYYLALELVDGMDLRAFMKWLEKRDRKLPASLVAFIAQEVLMALEYAHGLEVDGSAHPVVHRDISPSNILLSREGEVKLADFGIAKAVGQSHETKSGVIRGKAPYMAPEQAMAHKVDGRTDLFALGVTLYELIAGHRPFDGPTDVATLLNIAQGKRLPLKQHAPDTPDELVDLIDTMLCHGKDGRPKDAAAALDMLAQVETAASARRQLGALIREASPSGPTAVTATSRPPPPRWLRTARSRSRVLLLGSVVAGCLVLGSWFVVDSLRRGPEQSAEGSSQTTEPVTTATEQSRANARTEAKQVTSVSTNTSSNREFYSGASAESASEKRDSTGRSEDASADREEPRDVQTRRRSKHHTSRRQNQESSSAARATLTVAVLPFGVVSIAGRPAKSAPQTASLKPGTHTIAYGKERASMSKKVTLSAGESKRVVLSAR